MTSRSLTSSILRTITLTRKLFTMVLSVVVYNHTLTLGQWGGAAVVFAGISVEAWVKRRGASSHRNSEACIFDPSSTTQMSMQNASFKKRRRPRSSHYSFSFVEPEAFRLHATQL